MPPPFPPEAVTLTRNVLRAVHLSDYRYVSSPRLIETNLRLIPPKWRGWQRLISEEVRVAPLPHSIPRVTDTFGNLVVEVHHEQVLQHLTLAVVTVVESVCAYDALGRLVPTPVPQNTHLSATNGLNAYLEFTPLTTPDDALKKVAREVEQDAPTEPLERLSYLADLVHQRMTFTKDVTTFTTTATEAWTLARGVCQDYTHILITLCRLLNLPARYVSGCVPGEGVMHAWVETLLPAPDGSGAFWYAIDPTYNHFVDARYLTVAAGRDYRDITPTSGSYYGGANELRHGSRITIDSTVQETIDDGLPV